MDYSLSSTIYTKFTTAVNGVPTALGGSPAVSAYANGSTTEITAGITLTQDFDGLTGLNHIAVVASVANGFAAGVDYSLVITAGTLNGTSIVGTVVGEFSLEKASSVAGIAAIDARLDNEIPEIKQVTDKLHSMLEAAPGSPGESRFTADALVRAPTGSGGGGGSGPSAAEIATAVWSEAVPGAFAAGQAGQILGDNLNATVSSRSSQASVDTLAGYVDTEVAAIKAKTDNLPTDPADASDIATAFATVNATLSTIDGRLDTEIPQIKQVTDKLHSMLEVAPGSPGESRFSLDALRHVPTLVWGAERSGFTTAGSFGQYVPANVTHFGGAAGTFAAGRPEVNTTHAAGTAWNSGAIQAATLATDTITADKIAADAIGASELAADAITEIQSGLATAANLAIVAGYVDTEVAAIKAKTDNLPADPADASDIAAAFATVNSTLSTIDSRIDTEVPAIKQVTDKLHSMIEAAPGSPGESRFTADSLVNTAVVLPNINAIKAKTDNLPADPADASDIAASFATVNTKLDTIDDFLDTEVAAIKAKTDALPTDPADASDIAAAFATVNSTLSTIDGRLDTEIPQIKQVTDKLHSMVETAPGSPGESRFTADALVLAPTGSGGGGSGPSAATIAAAVWSEALPGSFTAGQAGKIVGDNLNATVGSRATQASVDTIDGIVDSILVDTDITLPSTLATIASYIDTEVGAIKAKTDNLPASPAASGDIPSAGAIADAIWDEALSGHVSAGTAGAALRDADLRGSRVVCRGTVSGTSPTSTTLTPSALTPAGASIDQFKGRVLIFDIDTATAGLRGQGTGIISNTDDALPLLTFDALSVVPAAGDTFTIA